MSDMDCYCYGCCKLLLKFWGDGTKQYECGLAPGLVIGMVGILDDDEPKRCERYTQLDATQAQPNAADFNDSKKGIKNERMGTHEQGKNRGD